jgi:hypothetical protein
MNIMTDPSQKSNEIDDRVELFFNRFRICSLLRKIGATKTSGVASCLIVVFLLKLVFSQKNFFRTFSSGRISLPYSKDVVYRFLGKSSVNWEMLVPSLSNVVIPVINQLTSTERRKALIIDDSPYYRDRSKKVELLSRFKDHSTNRYYKGFNMLNMGWSDGVSFIPVDFRMVASNNDDCLLEGSHIKEDNRTIATRRRKQARTPKPELVIEMLKNVKGTSAQTQHVLFDSLFSPPKAILDIKRLGYDVVARLKNHKNYRYLYNEQTLSLGEIYRLNKKRPGKAKYLLSVNVEVRHKDYPETISAKIVFVRNSKNKKEWFALISTDITLSEEEIIELYGKRWDIEPYHKVLKSTLKLEKEFQLRSFDAIVAHAALVVVRYIFLALESRENIDERSIGDLFWFTCDELKDISFSEAFELLVSTFVNFLREQLVLADDIINSLVLRFSFSLPAYIKDRLPFQLCES